MSRFLAALSATLIVFLSVSAQERRIDLSGSWTLRYGDGAATTVELPATMDTNRKGHPLQSAGETTRLSRLYSYRGKAWYERTVVVPRAWADKPLTLFLERTKPSWLYIDGRLVDSCCRISTPHRYTIPALRPGNHTIRLLIDNGSGVPEQLYGSSHAYTEDTQTNWNGIIGQMYIEPCETAKAAGENGRAGQRVAGAEGLSPLTAHDGHLYDARGHRVFLRGKHDACVWPLTGHCPMDLRSWLSYLGTCREYGINHVRFHSWCPPEASFQAADRLGIYLQPELPFWGDFNAADTVLMDFLHAEGEAILREYSHHPSFAMFALGNELWGSIEQMGRFVGDFRRLAPHVLFTFGSNYYLGYQGVQPGMDYFTTCRVGGEAWGSYATHTRGSFSFADAKTGGLLNSEYPNTLSTLDAGCRRSPVPVISHETGQFQVFPDFREIDKYTGVLRPCNLETFRARLDSAGMLHQAALFQRASGLWALQLYKADIELDLRTESMSGFQLLDLQDYPGQGSAYVGMLDAFMESKGLCTAGQWRQWCSEVVPLALMPSYSFIAGQRQDIEVRVANYSGRSLKGQTLVWSAGNMEGHFPLPDGEGLLRVGTIPFEVPLVRTAWDTSLSLHIAGTPYHNTYKLWLYPQQQPIDAYSITVTHRMTPDIVARLEAGGKVLWMPDSAEMGSMTVGPLFQTDYWNYRMFRTICENNGKPVSPGTLGILTDPAHPLFCEFCTDAHTNWQWFPIVHHSRPAILDRLPRTYFPIVQVIDNVERCHKLGLVFEFAVGRGKLLVCMSDLDQAKAYPEGRQFYRSLLLYMQGDDFRPRLSIGWADLQSALTGSVRERSLQQLNNISPY